MLLTLTLDRRAAFGLGSTSSNVVATAKYVPGAVVRGALAAAWIARRGAPDAAFDELFEGPVTFGPLFSGDPPLALSVLVHKRGVDELTCLRRWWDRAVEPVELVPAGNRCPDCGGPLEPSKGKLTDDPPVVRETHVQLEERVETAKHGDLFTRETIRGTGLTFRGRVDGPKELLEELTEFSRVRVGGRRSTGGGASVTWQEDPQPALGAQRRGDGSFVLRLASPGIFVDDIGRPSRSPDRAELGRILGAEVALGEPWTRWTTVSGWHVASGLPKPIDMAVEAGSTYVFRADCEIDDEALATLGARGLGLRRHEGFGAVAGAPVCRDTLAGIRHTLGPLFRMRPKGRSMVAAAVRAGTAEQMIAENMPDEVKRAVRTLIHIDDADRLNRHLAELEAER